MTTAPAHKIPARARGIVVLVSLALLLFILDRQVLSILKNTLKGRMGWTDQDYSWHSESVRLARRFGSGRRPAAPPLVWWSEGGSQPQAVLRSKWSGPRATFVGIKAGQASAPPGRKRSSSASSRT